MYKETTEEKQTKKTHTYNIHIVAMSIDIFYVNKIKNEKKKREEKK